jgi:cob(I)alamin adenosyltransferase
MMKIYTGGGDRGQTSLPSGERVAKNDFRVEAYGDVDELNAILGALAAALPSRLNEPRVTLQRIQSQLFTVGSWLATTADPATTAQWPAIDPNVIRALEADIDGLDDRLPPLQKFILPGGHPAAAWAHVARTVCRRAERHAVSILQRPDSVSRPASLQNACIYLNRLSDYLFVLARYCNRVSGTAEIELGF